MLSVIIPTISLASPTFVSLPEVQKLSIKSSSCVDGVTAPCTYQFVNAADMGPAKIASSMLCKKVFNFNAPSSTGADQDWVIFRGEFSKGDGTIINPLPGFQEWANSTTPIKDVVGGIGLVRGGTSYFFPETDGFKLVSYTFAHKHGTGIISRITPFDKSLKFIISKIISPDDALFDVATAKTFGFCKLEGYNNPLLAQIVYLNPDNTLAVDPGLPGFVCMYGNTVDVNGTKKSLMVLPGASTYGSVKFTGMGFFTATATDLSQTEIDKLDACRIDSDGDFVPDWADPCPNSIPKEMTGTSGAATNHRTAAAADYNYVLTTFEKDTDRDGVGDRCDNCPDVSNPYQETDASGGCENLATCNIDTYTDDNFCDIVTDDEKQQLGSDPFNSVGIEITLPAFTFNTNSSRSGKTCNLGKISVGGTQLINCSTANTDDPNYSLCNTGCRFDTESNCFYKARFSLAPNILKSIAANEPGVNDFFDTPSAVIPVTVEVTIPSDYLATNPGNFSNNIGAASYVTTDNHTCTFNIDTKKELATITNVECKLKVNNTDYVNIANSDDYKIVTGKSLAACK